MTDSITPPPELVSKWANMFEFHSDAEVFSEVAQWGADQELNACCEWTQGYAECGDSLRAARRPKPPSLKEQALEALDMHFAAIGEGQCYQAAHKDTIRRALEQLDD
jgi:hypothetical protein